MGEKKIEDGSNSGIGEEISGEKKPATFEDFKLIAAEFEGKIKVTKDKLMTRFNEWMLHNGKVAQVSIDAWWRILIRDRSPLLKPFGYS
jgi:hypothetical protein